MEKYLKTLLYLKRLRISKLSIIVQWVSQRKGIYFFNSYPVLISSMEDVLYRLKSRKEIEFLLDTDTGVGYGESNFTIRFDLESRTFRTLWNAFII